MKRLNELSELAAGIGKACLRLSAILHFMSSSRQGNEAQALKISQETLSKYNCF